MKSKISPSMMCADIGKFNEIIDTFNKTGIEYLHIDIMDGSFVQNYCLGTDYCRNIREYTNIPLDIHLMINNTDEKIKIFDIKPNDIVSVHAESTIHLQRALTYIKNKGAKAFVALNPGTPLLFLEEVINDIDGVLLMTVNPGFAGQKIVPSSFDKITRTRNFLDSHARTDAHIEVDGNITLENAVKTKKAGADIFVVGTSGIFKKDFPLEMNVARFREAVE